MSNDESGSNGNNGAPAAPAPSIAQLLISRSAPQVQTRQSAAPADSSVNVRGNTVETRATTHTQTSRMVPRDQGVLASAHKYVGGGPAAQIDDKTLVYAHGTEMEVRTAVQLGLLRRTGSGGYEETGRGVGGRPLPTAPEQAAAPKTPIQPLAPSATEAAQNLRDALPPEILNRVIESVITKGRGAQAITHLASDLGIDGAALHATVATAVDGYQRQADEIIGGMGFDPAHFYAWAAKNHRDELRNAMREQFHGLGVESYVTLAERYARKVAPDAATLKEGGYETFYDKNTHTQMVKINGTAMSVAAAAKAGLI